MCERESVKVTVFKGAERGGEPIMDAEAVARRESEGLPDPVEARRLLSPSLSVPSSLSFLVSTSL